MKQMNEKSLQNQYSELMHMIKKSYKKSDIERFCSMADEIQENVNVSIYFSNQTIYGN